MQEVGAENGRWKGRAKKFLTPATEFYLITNGGG